jgi:predicted dehydrogenase|tara:strand:- start:3651 stop:4514 length:864 start_codon:yes stop_codon:yes gene_type:complete
MNLAIIGVGYWGSKIAETARLLNNVTVKTFDVNDPWHNESIDAAVIATPAETHNDITRILLDKHIPVLVEKPIADSFAQVQELIELADKNNTVMQSGHILLFTKTTEYIKENFDTSNLKLLETRRLNFGNIPAYQIPLEKHLLIHDLALVDYIKQEKIKRINTNGIDVLSTEYNDYTITNIEFETFSSTHHCSWFYPIKTRSVSVISNKELVYVDDNTNGIIHKHGDYNSRLTLKEEQTITIKDNMSPLQRELEHFLNSVENNDNNSINGIAHIERVYANLETITNA